MVTILNWAILDITFTPVSDGVKCVVVTDSLCHLYMRWSTTPPRKHPLSRTFRGLKVMAGTRFCFVAWQENEQEEEGDTLIHTFLKPNWTYCQTRWFYFRGTKAGEDSPSASCLFEYHNAFYPPEQMFYAFEPERLVIPGIASWQKVDRVISGTLKDLLPSDTEVVFLHVVEVGSSQRFGLRPVGSTHNYREELLNESHTWAHVKVDDDNCFEIWQKDHINTEVWLMGYALSPAVSMLTNPIEKTFGAGSTWVDVSTLPQGEGAIGVLVETARDVVGYMSGLRMKGSTDNHLYAMQRNWAVIGLDSNHIFQCWPEQIGEYFGKLYIWGFVKSHADFNTNAVGVTPDILDTYKVLEVPPIPHLAFIEILGAPFPKKYALRPLGSAEDIYLTKNWGHCFAITPQDIFGRFEGKVENELEQFWHLGSGT